jgi:hypothetical protein
MAPQPIRWMHLSDLHMGCRGEEIWWQVRSEFRDSIEQYFRPIDMILLTGDVTFSAPRLIPLVRGLSVRNSPRCKLSLGVPQAGIARF